MKKHIFLFTSVIVILAIVIFVAYKSFDFSAVAEKETNEITPPQLPRVISNVKTLEIVNVRIDNPSSPTPIILIDVKNNSPKPIVAVRMESGDKKGSSGTIISGFVRAPPRIIVLPFQVSTLDFPLSNVVRDLPIRISGVMYIDGSEDGEAKAINDIRGHRQSVTIP